MLQKLSSKQAKRRAVSIILNSYPKVDASHHIPGLLERSGGSAKPWRFRTRLERRRTPSGFQYWIMKASLEMAPKRDRSSTGQEDPSLLEVLQSAGRSYLFAVLLRIATWVRGD